MPRKILFVLSGIAVIGIVVLVALWNPLERAREARDAQRIVDLAKIKQAIALYLAVVQKPDLDVRGACGQVYSEGTTAVDGSGWVPVNLTLIPGGSPLPSALPLDPLNTDNYVYEYQCDETKRIFKLRATMESKKYSKDGPYYEVGTSVH